MTWRLNYTGMEGLEIEISEPQHYLDMVFLDHIPDVFASQLGFDDIDWEIHDSDYDEAPPQNLTQFVPPDYTYSKSLSDIALTDATTLKQALIIYIKNTSTNALLDQSNNPTEYSAAFNHLTSTAQCWPDSTPSAPRLCSGDILRMHEVESNFFARLLVRINTFLQTTEGITASTSLIREVDRTLKSHRVDLPNTLIEKMEEYLLLSKRIKRKGVTPAPEFTVGIVTRLIWDTKPGNSITVNNRLVPDLTRVVRATFSYSKTFVDFLGVLSLETCNEQTRTLYGFEKEGGLGLQHGKWMYCVMGEGGDGDVEKFDLTDESDFEGLKECCRKVGKEGGDKRVLVLHELQLNKSHEPPQRPEEYHPSDTYFDMTPQQHALEEAQLDHMLKKAEARLIFWGFQMNVPKGDRYAEYPVLSGEESERIHNKWRGLPQDERERINEMYESYIDGVMKEKLEKKVREERKLYEQTLRRRRMREAKSGVKRVDSAS
ncbi:hypothetical protein EJ08DRAFT_470509 [Tothia fuscella]|uniref:Uncharacterized protein n=1 Tax=Tothia fuscella TaxID=1048955 RepID=A0A9P4NZM0_9PEZI|nr:hypothetical protein EJ08DRAFT_470509 [Tothia fuscella]